MEKEINQLKEQFTHHAASDETNFALIRGDIAEIKELIQENNKRLDPVFDAYKAVIFSKSFITGLAAVVMAIGVIGGGILWVLNNYTHK